MTTTSSSSTTIAPAGPASWPALAAIGIGLAAVLTAIGTFWDITGNDSGSSDNAVTEYLVVLGIILVGAAVTFGVVVRTATPENGGRRAIILAVLAVLSLVVFWAGLPTVLAAGAAACALVASPRGALSKTSLVLAAVVSVLAVVAAVTA